MVYQIRTKNCKQCAVDFSKRMPEDQEYCSVVCKMAYRNDPVRNPSKSPEARKKISESRKGKPTSLGVPCPEKKKRKIAKALRGKPTGRKPSQRVIEAWIKSGAKNLCHESGLAHPMWKGGLAKSRQARYKEPEYIEWHDKCLERDNYACQKCGARNGNGVNIVLQVHHKIHFWERPDLIYDLNNGITFCKSCHQKSHKGMKKPKVPRLQ